MNKENLVDEKDIIPAFRDSVFRDNTDILQECGEIAFDAILGQNIFSGIPIISMVSAICKAGLNIRERNYLKQTLAFMKGFNTGGINQKKIEAYRKKLASDGKRAERELGRVIVILNSTIEHEQSEVLGRFYKAYVWENYDWDTFRLLSAVNQRLMFNDYETIRFISNRFVNSEEITSQQRSSVERLQALGLVLVEGEIKMTCGTSLLNKYGYYISKLGQLFNFYSIEGNAEKKLILKEK